MKHRNHSRVRHILALAAAAIAMVGTLATSDPAMGAHVGGQPVEHRASSLSDIGVANMTGIVVRNRTNRLCLNAPGTDGSIVLQLGCGGGWGVDRWNVIQVPNRPGLYEIRNAVTNRCLEIGGWSTADGAAAMTFGCHGGANQRWWVTRRGDGAYELKNEASNRCLDTRFTHAWTSVYQWGCHGGWEQQWDILP